MRHSRRNQAILVLSIGFIAAIAAGVIKIKFSGKTEIAPRTIWNSYHSWSENTLNQAKLEAPDVKRDPYKTPLKRHIAKNKL